MIEKLKVSVENKFGRKIKYQKDCKALSSCIIEVTGEYLSPATIRRIFGFLLTNSNPSRVTLDILSRYIGLKDWDHFSNNRESRESQAPILDTWNRAKVKSLSISHNTLDHIKRKSGITFNQTVQRQFADDHIDYLFKSEFNATAFVGPGGYGKSTMLANWYEKNIHKKKFSNDIILFLQASSIDYSANTETYFEDWIMRLFGISIENNFLDSILRNNDAPGRFILVLDALDETTAQGAKLEKLFKSIADFYLKYSETYWFKVIVSSRLFTWDKFKTFLINSQKWFNTNPDSFAHDGANMPPLTGEEIQKIIDNTINSKFPKRLLLEELNFELRETLSYPYFLQLFINVYHPETEYLLHDQIEIYREFIKKQVYQAQYSEEKIDILYKIIELTDYGLKPNDVKKNTLKDIYPIHLKLAGNYFAAYEDLLSFGLLIEEEIESKFGGFNRTVRIANPSLYEILLTQILLEKEGGITFDLFSRIESQYSGTEILAPLITRMFQFAYRDRIVEPLKRFFELKKETLKVVLSSPALVIALRKDEYMRKVLIPIYLKEKEGKKYFFENYIDINHLQDSFSYILTQYTSVCCNEEEKLFANELNIYSGILGMDLGKVERHYKQIENFAPTLKHEPYIIGRLYACKCMYAYFLKQPNLSKIIEEAIAYKELLNKSDKNSTGLIESIYYSTFIVTSQFEVLRAVISSNKAIEIENRNKSLILYRLFINLIDGIQLKTNDFIEIERVLTKLNPTNSYNLRILGLILKSSFHLKNNDINKAYDCFRTATELSNISGYKLFEVKLLKALAKALLDLGENTKSTECSKFAESLVEKTGFDYDLL